MKKILAIIAALFLIRPLRARARGLPWAALAALLAWFVWRNFGW